MSLKRSALVAVFWRAVRLSLPLALSSCAPPRATPVSFAQRDCSTNAGCAGGPINVEVQTAATEGTVLDRYECDVACRPVMCPARAKTCVVHQPGGNPVVTCTPEGANDLGCPVPGRPVPEWAHRTHDCATAEQFFSQMAVAEAESVAEFERLAVELELHDAPTRLIERARTAATEERRHARVSAQLAGDAPPMVPAPPAAGRSLVQLAEANLLEGCINETMSAVLVASQSEHAPSGHVRAQLTSVAHDELSHADFSWDLHEWLMSRLTPAERAALAPLANERIAMVLARPVQPLPENVRAKTGLPDETVARAQAEALAHELWWPAIAALA